MEIPLWLFIVQSASVLVAEATAISLAIAALRHAKAAHAYAASLHEGMPTLIGTAVDQVVDGVHDAAEEVAENFGQRFGGFMGGFFGGAVKSVTKDVKKAVEEAKED